MVTVMVGLPYTAILFHAVFPGFAMVTVALKTAQKAQFSAIALLQKALAKAK